MTTSREAASMRRERVWPRRDPSTVFAPERTIGDYAPVLDHYAKLAADYDRKWGRYCRRTLSEALHQLALRGDEQVLDVACGTGLLAQMLRSEWPSIRFVGVDLSEQMLAVARLRLPEQPGVEWRLGKAEQLPLPSGRFEIVTCTNAFHLVADQVAALSEFRRVLQPGGTLVLIDWCRDYLAQKGIQIAAHLFGRQARRVLTVREAEDLLSRTGFAVRRSRRFKATWLWGMYVLQAAGPVFAPASNSTDEPARGHLLNRAATAEIYVARAGRRPTDTPAV